MALALYRRHRRECKAGHSEELRTSEYDERKKGWKRCECPIVISGSLAKKFRRQTTRQWEWEPAREMAATWEAAGIWGVADPTPQVVPAQEAVDARVTVADATQAFLAKCKNRNIQPTTYAKYQTLSKQLTAYCESRGYYLIDQLTVSDMDRFYASWKDGVRGKAKKLERLKAFVKFCMKRKWLAEDVSDDLEAPQGASVTVPKTPFTDDELQRIYAACDKIGSPTKQGPGYRTWGGEDAKDFVYLSVYTGLRISDVATFDISKRLDGNNVFLRMHKTKRPLFTWIPTWLVDRLQARVPVNGPLIFGCGVTRNAKQLCDIWRNKRLKKVFQLSGPWETPAHPHRFRHTFVRILLEKGVPLADVAELIGDTEQILRKHYAAWIPGRQDRLSRILQEAFEGKSKPRVVAI
jgi:integrase